MTRNGIKRAAAVLRVSSASQADETKDSIPGQRRMAEEWCEAEGWKLAAVYDETTDKGFQSGRDPNNDRPFIQQMLSDAANGAFDVVIFRDNSRLGRDDVESMVLARDLRRGTGEVLVGFSDGRRVADINDPNDRLLFMVGAWQADVDYSTIKKNLARGRHGGAKKGHWTGGMPPLGYESTKDKRLVVHEGEAGVVRRMFELTAQGVTAREAAKVLNREFDRSTLPKRQGGRNYGNQHIYQVVRKPVYYGAGIERRIRPHPDAEPEVILVPAPPIVDEELWRAANDAMDGRRMSTTRGRKAQSAKYGLGNGRVRHVHPDGNSLSMTGANRRDRQWNGQPATLRFYRCSASVARRGRYEPNDPHRCPGFGETFNRKRRTTLNARFVEADLLLQLLEHLKSPETLATWIREQDARAMQEAALEDLGIGTPEDVLTAAKERLAELVHEREVVNRQERKGRISEEQADEAHEALDLEEAKLHGIVVRQQAVIARRQEFTLTFDDLVSMPIGMKLGEVDWETTYVTDPETGENYVEEPGWTEVAKWLHAEAQGVFDGTRYDLSELAIEWLARMADIFDIVVNVYDVGESSPMVKAEGSIPLEPVQIGSEANTDLRRTPRRGTR